MSGPLNLSSSWTLCDATVVAIAANGKVFNDRGLTLALSEGREVELYPGEKPNDDMDEVWTYRLTFYIKDGPEPNDSIQYDCSVSITGTLEDGRPCKIQGEGYVGRDDLGQIEGSFVTPPRIELVSAEARMIDAGDEA